MTLCCWQFTISYLAYFWKWMKRKMNAAWWCAVRVASVNWTATEKRLACVWRRAPTTSYRCAAPTGDRTTITAWCTATPASPASISVSRAKAIVLTSRHLPLIRRKPSSNRVIKKIRFRKWRKFWYSKNQNPNLEGDHLDFGSSSFALLRSFMFFFG